VSSAKTPWSVSDSISPARSVTMNIAPLLMLSTGAPTAISTGMRHTTQSERRSQLSCPRIRALRRTDRPAALPIRRQRCRDVGELPGAT
jgi:hypothetical protein